MRKINGLILHGGDTSRVELSIEIGFKTYGDYLLWTSLLINHTNTNQ